MVIRLLEPDTVKLWVGAPPEPVWAVRLPQRPIVNVIDQPSPGLAAEVIRLSQARPPLLRRRRVVSVVLGPAGVAGGQFGDAPDVAVVAVEIGRRGPGVGVDEIEQDLSGRTLHEARPSSLGVAKMVGGGSGRIFRVGPIRLRPIGPTNVETQIEVPQPS